GTTHQEWYAQCLQALSDARHLRHIVAHRKPYRRDRRISLRSEAEFAPCTAHRRSPIHCTDHLGSSRERIETGSGPLVRAFHASCCTLADLGSIGGLPGRSPLDLRWTDWIPR